MSKPTPTALRRIGWLAVAAVSLLGATAGNAAEAPLVWRLDGVKMIGGYTPLILGSPQTSTAGPGIWFDGRSDGLILPVDPLAGMTAFTIEALIQPAPDGPTAQRFLHIEDEHGNRATMEIRLAADGRWALDTFLLCGDSWRALLDETRLHPAARWTWVALRYDGRQMTSFVDGVQELEGAVHLTPFTAGRIALGVRLNQVYWFKGAIREVRFHARALAPPDLQRTK